MLLHRAMKTKTKLAKFVLMMLAFRNVYIHFWMVVYMYVFVLSPSSAITCYCFGFDGYTCFCCLPRSVAFEYFTLPRSRSVERILAAQCVYMLGECVPRVRMSVLSCTRIRTPYILRSIYNIVPHYTIGVLYTQCIFLFFISHLWSVFWCVYICVVCIFWSDDMPHDVCMCLCIYILFIIPARHSRPGSSSSTAATKRKEINTVLHAHVRTSTRTPHIPKIPHLSAPHIHLVCGCRAIFGLSIVSVCMYALWYNI